MLPLFVVTTIPGEHIQIVRIEEVETVAQADHGSQDGDLFTPGMAEAALLRPGPGLLRSILPEVDAMSEPVVRVLASLVPFEPLDNA